MAELVCDGNGQVSVNDIVESINGKVTNVPTGEYIKTVASSTSADPTAFDFPNIVEAFDWVQSVRAVEPTFLRFESGEHLLPATTYYLGNVSLLMTPISNFGADVIIVGNPELSKYTSLKFSNSVLIIQNIIFDFSRIVKDNTRGLVLNRGNAELIFTTFILAGNSGTAIDLTTSTIFTGREIEIYSDGSPITRAFVMGRNTKVLIKDSTFSNIAQLFSQLGNSQIVLDNPTLTNVASLGVDKINEIGKNGSFLKIGEEGLMTQAGDYGDTASRPPITTNINSQYFDTDLNKPIWWNGLKWVEADRGKIINVECTATYIPDLAISKVLNLTLTEDLVVTDFVNSQDGDRGSFRIYQDDVGGHAISGSAYYQLIGFVAGDITLPAGQYAYITFEVVGDKAFLQLIYAGA